MPTQKREYYLYDGRATGAQGTDKALVLSSGYTSKQEARKDAQMYSECACYSYEVGVVAFVHDDLMIELTDEQWEFDFWPNTGIIE